jgi:hypothetical protein
MGGVVFSPDPWPILGSFNPHTNGSDQQKMAEKYGESRCADGARQTKQLTGRKKDVGTHNHPAPQNHEHDY